MKHEFAKTEAINAGKKSADSRKNRAARLKLLAEQGTKKEKFFYSLNYIWSSMQLIAVLLKLEYGWTIILTVIFYMYAS